MLFKVFRGLLLAYRLPVLTMICVAGRWCKNGCLKSVSRFLLGISLLLSVTGFSLAVSAMPMLYVDADPGTPGVQSTNSVEAGSTFDVDIWIDGLLPPQTPPQPLNGMAGFDFTLLFDPSILTGMGVASGGFLPLLLPPLPVPPASPGGVRYGEVSILPAIAVEGRLATVSFEALSSGSSVLDFDLALTDLTGPFGLSLAYLSAPATITITDSTTGTVPIPATSLLLLLGLLGLRIARKQHNGT